jgi:hypothetical protein
VTHQLDLQEVADKEIRLQLAASAKDGKVLNATFTGDGRRMYEVELHAGGETQTLYQGSSLENAVYCYNTGVALEPSSKSHGATVQEVIAKSELIPSRRAALDRARIRRALSTLYFAGLSTLSDDELAVELCKTPEGKAQYEKIRARGPGDPYSAIRPASISVEELVVSLISTPEDRAQFEEARVELRAALGATGPGEEMQTTLSKAALSLLQKARTSLADGLESADAMEPDWSKEDRALVARIDDVLGNYLAKELLASV